MTTRQSLKEIIDDLPDSVLEDVEAAIRSVVSPDVSELRQFLEAAPYDDEPLTEDELAAIAEADAEFESSRGVPHKKVKEMIARWPTR